jgi:hypothetical protein
MWDDQTRARFQELRRRELAGMLTAADQAELARLAQELEDAEAAYLGPATERLRMERERLETQNRVLQSLVERKQALCDRLRVVLAEAATERHGIETELAHVLGEPSVVEAGHSR